MNTKSLLLAGALAGVGAMVLDMANPEKTDISGPLISGEITTITYDVSGSDLASLERQMNFKGPRGHWAYTRTSWDWDATCNVTFKARVTLPKLVARSRLDANERAAWDRMIVALTVHEMNHVKIGQGWAAAIKEADCTKEAIARIDREWKNRDSRYDRRTDHGRTEGVYLTQP